MTNSLFEIILFSIGPLGSLVAAKLGRKAWFMFELASTIGFSLALMFQPDKVMYIVMKSPLLKPYHYFLCAFFGCQLINIMLYPIFLKDSQDKSIYYGHYFARLIEHSLIVMDNVVAYSEGRYFNYKYLCFGASFAISHAIGNAYFLFTTPRPSSEKKTKRELADIIGKMDFYLCLISGIYMYAFPDRFNLTLGGSKTQDESFRSLTRSGAAFLIGTSLASFCMSEFFKTSQDKKAFMLSRMLGNVFELFVILAGYYVFGAFSFNVLVTLIGLNIGYYLPHIYGYVYTTSSPKEHTKSK